MIGRHIEGGLHDDFDITNNSWVQHPRKVRFNPGDRDHARISPTSSRSRAIRIVRRGRITTSWSDKRRQVLRIGLYRNRDFCREVIVRTGEGAGEPAVNTNGRLSFAVALTKAETGLAPLPDLRPGGWREAHPGAAEMHLF